MELTKNYYRISEVSEILGIPATTLRFWEKEFPQLKPTRNQGKHRYYTPEDVEFLRMVNFLVRDRGMRISAAKEQLRVNSTLISKKVEIISKLEDVSAELKHILASLEKRR